MPADESLILTSLVIDEVLEEGLEAVRLGALPAEEYAYIEGVLRRIQELAAHQNDGSANPDLELALLSHLAATWVDKMSPDDDGAGSE